MDSNRMSVSVQPAHVGRPAGNPARIGPIAQYPSGARPANGIYTNFFTQDDVVEKSRNANGTQTSAQKKFITETMLGGQNGHSKYAFTLNSDKTFIKDVLPPNVTQKTVFEHYLPFLDDKKDWFDPLKLLQHLNPSTDAEINNAKKLEEGNYFIDAFVGGKPSGTRSFIQEMRQFVKGGKAPAGGSGSKPAPPFAAPNPPPAVVAPDEDDFHAAAAEFASPEMTSGQSATVRKLQADLLRSEVKRLEANNEGFAKRNEALTAEVSRYKSTIADLEQSQDFLSDSLSSERSINASLTGDVARLSDENGRLKKDLQDIAKKDASEIQKQTIERLSEDVNQKTLKINVMQRDTDDLKAQNARLEARIRKMEENMPDSPVGMKDEFYDSQPYIRPTFPRESPRAGLGHPEHRPEYFPPHGDGDGSHPSTPPPETAGLGKLFKKWRDRSTESARFNEFVSTLEHIPKSFADECRIAVEKNGKNAEMLTPILARANAEIENWAHAYKHGESDTQTIMDTLWVANAIKNGFKSEDGVWVRGDDPKVTMNDDDIQKIMSDSHEFVQQVRAKIAEEHVDDEGVFTY